MTSVEKAQQALTEARAELRATEHEELCALNARDRLRGLLASTVEVKEHVKLKAEMEKAESRIEISVRQTAQARSNLSQAEMTLRRERELAQQRGYALRNELPHDLERLTAALEGEKFNLTSAEAKLDSSERMLAHVQRHGPASRLFECQETVRQAKDVLRVTRQRVSEAEERLRLKREYLENLTRELAA